MKPNFLRLIFTCHSFKQPNEVQVLAKASGYTMYTANGIVYSIVGDELFKLSDLLTDY